MILDRRQIPPKLNRSDFVWASIAGIFSLIVYGWLMILWRNHGVFAQYNILFDTDPNIRLGSLAHGWGSEGLVHPLFSYLFSIPIRFAAWCVGKFSSVGDVVLLREAIAAWIAPSVSALKVFIVFLVGRAIGASLLGAGGLCLLAGFSFAPAIYGALPEHYPMSGAALTIAFAWALAVSQGRMRDNHFIWFAIAVLVAGMTLTNCAAVLALFFACRIASGMPIVKAFVGTFLLGLAAISFTTGSAALAGKISQSQVSSTGMTEFVGSYWRKSIADEPVRYLSALANTIAAPVPAVMPNSLIDKERAQGRKAVDVQFTYDNRPVAGAGWLRILVMFALVVGGAIQGWRSPPFRPIVFAAILVLVFNGVLHIAWGSEWFLYAMHWQPALLFLLAGIQFGNRKVGSMLLLTTGLFSALWSGVVIREMLTILERAPT
jgi:hypothetical protein